MAGNEWFTKLEKIEPYIYKIKTPTGSGTGFQIKFSKNKRSICGIATALHVVGHANDWEEPIKITHWPTKQEMTLHPDERVIIVDSAKDIAFILFNCDGYPAPESALELIPPKSTLMQGVEVGWYGFPAMAPDDLCFFSGHISCYLSGNESYLVDGVAINGVSGGPAFFINPSTNEISVSGVISAYIPNTSTGVSMPGLSVVRAVEPYQKMLEELKSLEDAAKKAEEEKDSQRQESLEASPEPNIPL